MLRIGVCAVVLAAGCELVVGCGNSRVDETAVGEPPRESFDTLEQRLTAAEWPADALVVTNSALVDQRTQFSGNIVATRASAGAVLDQNAELTVANEAIVDGSVKADTLYLGDRANVLGAGQYNEKRGPGTVTGAKSSPLSLPVPITIPSLPAMSAGSVSVVLSSNEQRTLTEGAYAAATLSQGNGGGKTKLTLAGGVFTFASLSMGTDTRLECSAACEIRVVGSVQVGARSYLGPAAVPGLGAGNVQLLVKGSNGSSGPLGTPAACNVDNDVSLRAYVLAPNGTTRIGQRITQQGKFVTKDFWWGIDGHGDGVQLPVITQHPSSKTVWEHQPVTFSVVATVPDDTTITYQWQRNGANLPGKTAASLTLASTAMSDNGAQFRVLVRTDAGTVTSNTATLTVTRCKSVDTECNGQDDDCDGAVDDDYAPSCSGASRVACVTGRVVTTSCDNGEVCDGTESCVFGHCIAGKAVPDATMCDDGIASNGPERCDGHGECVDAPHTWEAAPVRLEATAPTSDSGGGSGSGGSGSGSVSEAFTPSPVTFEVPAFIPVSSGNAGQGIATLSFDGPSGTSVTCTYQGAALTPHPSEFLDKLLGLRYYLQSCSDGTGAGDSVTTSHVTFEVESGDADFPSGPPTVKLDLGGGCSGTIPAPMQGAEVAFIRQEFDWAATDPLEEVSVVGRPALWHGLIYIEREEQLTALDQARILWSTMPFSQNYSESLIGKCGRVEHSTDGFGTMIYAIFPARWWNLMRTFALQAAEAGIEPPFSVIAPSSPEDPGMLESDGSVSYSALATSGYHLWLAERSAAQRSRSGMTLSMSSFTRPQSLSVTSRFLP